MLMLRGDVVQMAQLPLIIIGRIKLFRDYPALGNVGLSAFVSTLHQRATDVFFGCPTVVLLDWITEWFPLTRSLVRFPVSLSEVCQRFSQS